MSLPTPARMQAVLLDPVGGVLRVGEVPVPCPGPGQVLVRMAASPINPSDLGFLKGAYEIQRVFPVVPGFEGSGTVIAAGPGVLPRLWLGRNVACHAPPTAGGAWAEYMVTAATSCIPLARNFPMDRGAMLIVNPLSAIAFFDIARRGGHVALVSNAAAGALGRMVLRLGQTKGIPIINVVRRQSQVKLLESMGAQYVLDSSTPDFNDRLRGLSEKLRATLILDPVAGDQAIQLLDAAPSGSTLLVYGALSGGEIRVAPRGLIAAGKRIEGFFLANWARRKNVLQMLMTFRKVLRLASNELRSDVQQRFPLSEINQAVVHYQRDPTAGKVLLVAAPCEQRAAGEHAPRTG